jgi:hypothetical protein
MAPYPGPSATAGTAPGCIGRVLRGGDEVRDELNLRLVKLDTGKINLIIRYIGVPALLSGVSDVVRAALERRP